MNPENHYTERLSLTEGQLQQVKKQIFRISMLRLALFIAGIAGLIFGVRYAIKHFEWFREGIKTLWDLFLDFTPFGTIIKITNHNLGIESTAYGIVVDRGGAIKKNHIDIFKNQLRAILRVSGIYSNIKILLPFVSSIEEIYETKAIIKELSYENEGIKISAELDEETEGRLKKYILE